MRPDGKRPRHTATAVIVVYAEPGDDDASDRWLVDGEGPRPVADPLDDGEDPRNWAGFRAYAIDRTPQPAR